MEGIIGKKLGMTQVFKDNGVVEPVTAIEAGPCVITQIKTLEKDGTLYTPYGALLPRFFSQNWATHRHSKPSSSANRWLAGSPKRRASAFSETL